MPALKVFCLFFDPLCMSEKITASERAELVPVAIFQKSKTKFSVDPKQQTTASGGFHWIQNGEKEESEFQNNLPSLETDRHGTKPAYGITPLPFPPGCSF